MSRRNEAHPVSLTWMGDNGLADERGRDDSLLTRQLVLLGASAADRGDRRITLDWRGASRIVDVPWHPASVWDDL
jgi:hypothetical protein